MHTFDRVGFLQAFIVAVDLYRKNEQNLHEEGPRAMLAAYRVGLVPNEYDPLPNNDGVVEMVQRVGSMYTQLFLRVDDALTLMLNVEQAYKHYCELLKTNK